MKKRNLFWGIFFILAAGFIIFDKLSLNTDIGVLNLVITLILIPIIVKSAVHLHFGGIFFPLAVIGILFSEPLGIEEFTPWAILGIALFLSIGFSFIFPRGRHLNHKDSHFDENFINAQTSSDSEDLVNIVCKYGSTVKYLTSSDLKEVNINVKCSGTKVYFDNASISGDTLKVNVEASLSGVDLYVPSDWAVKNNVDCLIGGIDIKNDKKIAKTKTIELNGYIRMAGIMIIYI